jgi:hypothetical protein
LGAGVVPVKVTDEVRVTQHGEWKVAQQGDWRVGVTGTVVAIPAMPNLVAVNRTYTVYWDHVNTDRVTVREIHTSGWARVEITGVERWINLTRARRSSGPRKGGHSTFRRKPSTIGEMLSVPIFRARAHIRTPDTPSMPR